MEELYTIKDALMRDLAKSETAKTSVLCRGEIDMIKEITGSIKNIYEILRMEDGGGYSRDGNYSINGNYRMDGRNDGYSYGRGGRMRDSQGRYSRDGYSMDGARDGMMEHIHEMLDQAPDERIREMIRRFKQEVERG